MVVWGRHESYIDHVCERKGQMVPQLLEGGTHPSVLQL